MFSLPEHLSFFEIDRLYGIPIAIFCVICQYQEKQILSVNKIANVQFYWDIIKLPYASYISPIFVEAFFNLLIKNLVYNSYFYWKINHCSDELNNYGKKRVYLSRTLILNLRLVKKQKLLHQYINLQLTITCLWSMCQLSEHVWVQSSSQIYLGFQINLSLIKHNFGRSNWQRKRHRFLMIKHF